MGCLGWWYARFWRITSKSLEHRCFSCNFRIAGCKSSWKSYRITQYSSKIVVHKFLRLSGLEYADLLCRFVTLYAHDNNDYHCVYLCLFECFATTSEDERQLSPQADKKKSAVVVYSIDVYTSLEKSVIAWYSCVIFDINKGDFWAIRHNREKVFFRFWQPNDWLCNSFFRNVEYGRCGCFE